MAGFISITDFGAKGDGVTNNHKAIQQAFDYAKINGLSVFIPNGVFAHSGTLVANGITIFGAGDGSVLKATEYGREALTLTGRSPSLSDLQLIGVAQGRLSTPASAKVLVENADSFSVENVHINGSSSVGIMVRSSSNGHIANNLVENTRADSIHMVAGTHHMVVEGNRVLNSGDDGISVVTYGGAAIVNHITIVDNEVLHNRGGRGISVVGGRDVVIEANTVVGGSGDAAGIYIAQEGQWSTEAVHNVRVSGNAIKDGGGLSTGHGAITIYNSLGNPANDGIVITNNDIEAPRKMAILAVGGGEQAVAVYENRILNSSHELLVNLNAKTRISTARPSTESNMLGGGGADALTGSAGDNALFGREGNDVLRGNEGADLLVGGAGNDILAGGSGADRLHGGAGSDTLDGGTGADWLSGGAGADTFVMSRGYGADTIAWFEQGIDKLDLRGLGYTSFAEFQNRVGITAGTGGASFLHLDFGSGDTLDLSGVKALTAGDVILAAGPSVPPVEPKPEPEPTPTPTPTPEPPPSPAPAPDVKSGTAGGDAIIGTASDDIIAGLAGNDRLEGRAGDDTLDGGTGNDRLIGGTGDDKLVGGAGSDELRGDGGNDVLFGGDGDDRLIGGTDDDRLDGGAGIDRLEGNAGNDVFVFARGYGQDTVVGFESGRDKVDLSAFGLGGMSDLSRSASIETGRNTVVIDFGSGDRLTILGLGNLIDQNLIF